MLKKIFVFGLVFVLFLSSSNLLNVTAASIVNADEEKQVKELAEMLEFLFVEAVKKDSLGNVIIDKEKIIEKYGSEKGSEIITEFNAYIPQKNKNNGIGTMSVAVDRCIANKISENFGWILGSSAISTVWSYLKAGEFTLAAKYLVKLGVKGSVPNIAVSLTGFFFYCLYTEEGWI